MEHKTVTTKNNYIAKKCFWAGIFFVGCFLHQVFPIIPENACGFMSGFAAAIFWWAE